MNKSKFSIAHKDKEMLELIEKTSQKTLAVWAIDCAIRVLPFFEKSFPEDNRPRNAIQTLQEWIKTGEFKMNVIRSASLSAHAAARKVKEDTPAKSAARACGQAVATAHVSRHSYGSAVYPQQAVFRAAKPFDAETLATKERDWQYNHLLDLRKN